MFQVSIFLVVVPTFLGMMFFVARSGETFSREQNQTIETIKKHSKDVKSFYFILDSNSSLINFFFAFQLDSLMLQIIEQPIEYKAYKIVPLNYRLLCTILTTSCSYFIVLLQIELNV